MRVADGPKYAILIPLVALACGGGGGPDDGLDAERTVRGDTTFVHVRSGSVWGAPASLVEEVRIGALDGEDVYLIGSISALAPDLEGGVYVFDAQVPALRHFDATGQYTRTLGGQGGGPGEYQDAALGLAVRRDGSVLLRDPRNARINVYNRDGEPVDHWPVASGLFTPRAMFLDTAEHVYLKILRDRPQPNQPWPIALLHLDERGEIVDTIPEPRLPGEPTGGAGVFIPAKLWDWSPHGHYVVGVNDRYVFESWHVDGKVTKVMRDHQPVPVRPEERSEWEARNAWLRDRQGRFMTAEIPPVPSVKPAYREIVVGEDGRVWIQRYMPSVKLEPAKVPDTRDGEAPALSWREPTVFDVFEPDGTYLGEVHVPERTTIWHFGTDRVWAVQRGELDESYIVAFRLQTGSR